jgi:hypothetical protein
VPVRVASLDPDVVGEIEAVRSKVSQLGLGFVVLHCAFWTAFAPVIPQLHQAFADHDHAFCPIHHRMEDLGRRQNPLAVSDTAGGPGLATHPGNATRLDLPHDCLFSSTAARVGATADSTPSCRLPAEPSPSPPTCLVEVPAIAVLFLAPKLPPPLCLV